jgi:hypothetical protein
MIFQSEEFNSLSQDRFKEKYSLNFKLSNLKEIHTELIIGCQLIIIMTLLLNGLE